MRCRDPSNLERRSSAQAVAHELAKAYGFYSNVNPAVAHPRHSQASEARLASLFRTMRTQLFNGYAAQVGSLYTGMDLRKYY